MRQVIFRSCILLFAAAGLAACSSGDDPSNPGGTGAGSTGPSTGPGGGPTGSSCKVVGDTYRSATRQAARLRSRGTAPGSA